MTRSRSPPGRRPQHRRPTIDRRRCATSGAARSRPADPAAAPAVGAACARASSHRPRRSITPPSAPSSPASCWRCFSRRWNRPSSRRRLPAIGKSLGDIDDLSWVVTAYLLAATAATPLFGKLSDIYGRRTSCCWRSASSSSARSPARWRRRSGCCVSRARLQGIGGGGLLPIAQTIIADLVVAARAPAWCRATPRSCS